MIGEDSGHGYKILDLLAPEQPLACLSGDRNSAPLKGLLIAPKITTGGGQKCDITSSAKPSLAVLWVEYRFTADQAGAHGCHSLCFTVAPLQGRGFSLFIGNRYVEGGN